MRYAVLCIVLFLLVLSLAGCGGATLPDTSVRRDVTIVANGFLGSLAMGDVEKARSYLHPYSPIHENLHIFLHHWLPAVDEAHALGCTVAWTVKFSSVSGSDDHVTARIKKMEYCLFCASPPYFAECEEVPEARNETMTFMKHHGKWRVY